MVLESKFKSLHKSQEPFLIKVLNCRLRATAMTFSLLNAGYSPLNAVTEALP
jgi:hypothetical protein